MNGVNKLGSYVLDENIYFNSDYADIEIEFYGVRKKVGLEFVGLGRDYKYVE